MNFRSWKTSAFGIVTLAVYVCGYIWPQHKEFFEGLLPIILAGGLLSAKDYNVTGDK